MEKFKIKYDTTETHCDEIRLNLPEESFVNFARNFSPCRCENLEEVAHPETFISDLNRAFRGMLGK